MQLRAKTLNAKALLINAASITVAKLLPGYQTNGGHTQRGSAEDMKSKSNMNMRNKHERFSSLSTWIKMQMCQLRLILSEQYNIL